MDYIVVLIDYATKDHVEMMVTDEVYRYLKNIPNFTVIIKKEISLEKFF